MIDTLDMKKCIADIIKSGVKMQQPTGIVSKARVG